MTPADLRRRDLLKSAAALPLAAVLTDPALVRAAASALEPVNLTTPSGHQVSAALALPQNAPAPGIILIHEWWGLNDQIKAVAAELAALGFAALAIDLYDGAVTDNPQVARTLVGQVKESESIEICETWAAWLRDHPATAEKLGSVGWCFGGGWSLTASLHAPVDATVIYYGNVNRTAKQLAALHGPVLGHFGREDRFINHAMANGFKANMAEAGKALTLHWYDAGHAFANPTSTRYDAGDAKLAWERTTAFFTEHLAS